MATRMLIDASHDEETRVVIVKGTRLEEFDLETSAKQQLKGNIYLAKVTRVEPSLQAAFVDYGGNRHGFLPFSEIHSDYYQIPVSDREALIEQDAAAEKAAQIEEEAAQDAISGSLPNADNNGAGKKSKAAENTANAELVAEEVENDDELSSDNGRIEEDLPVVETVVSDEDDKVENLGGEDADEERARPRKTTRRKHYKIQEVIKRRQILLVQVVKEERGNKGAALTTYLSLPGRYSVLMPNTGRGGGISRKIANPGDRKRLKKIASELEVPEGIGVIIRTAGLNRTKLEIKRDYEFLLRLWDDIRENTLKSIAPCNIYEEANLIKRSIRDLYNKDISEVLVEGEAGYKLAKNFMRKLMPSHAKKVQPYRDRIPLMHRFQVEQQFVAMYNPEVHLKSGGYIVINPTEALVAIDVNSGKATKERSIEETATKTNLEAAEEISRQLRLRDLAGLIVIDFIDMDDNRNNRAVEKRIKDSLKTDRARIQVGRISPFGLMEMSRQRLRPSFLESSTDVCSHCGGAGHVRSKESTALLIIRSLEEEGVRDRSASLTATAATEVAIYLLNQKRSVIQELETVYGVSIVILADPHMNMNDYRVEREKGSSAPASQQQQNGAEPSPAIAVVDSSEERVAEQSDEKESNSAKRRRRRRRRGRSDDQSGETQSNGTERQDNAPADQNTTAEGSAEQETTSSEEEPKRRRRGKRGGRRRSKNIQTEQSSDVAMDSASAPEQVSGDNTETAASEASKTDTDQPSVEGVSAPVDGAEVDAAKEVKKPRARRTRRKKTEAVATDDDTPNATPTDETAAASSDAIPEEDKAEKPKQVRPRRRRKTEKTKEEPAEQTAQENDPVKDTAGEKATTDSGETTEAPSAQTPVVKEQAESPAAVDPKPEIAEEAAKKPRRRGWWNRGEK